MRRTLMTWQGGRRRWRKWYKGVLYQVTAADLGCEETKDGSYQKANAWWLAKKAEVDGRRPVHPVVAEMQQRKDWLISKGLDPSAYSAWMKEAESMAQSDDLHPSILNSLLDSLSPSPEVWRDRLSRDKPETQPDISLKTQTRNYLDLLQARVDADNLSVGEYDMARLCLGVFSEWIGPEMPVTNITEERWQNWYKTIIDSGISVRYQKHRLRHSRNFVVWAVGMKLMTQPANLYSRLFKFGTDHKEVIPLKVGEALAVIEKARGQLKLHLMLMINCGFTQKDISDLRPEEIVWEEGRIDRRRSKTKKLKTPYVAWKLWQPTLDLLKQYARTTGDHALLTESGRTWVRDEIKNGKRSKTDSIKSLYVNAGLARTQLKRFRSTGASMIKKEFGAEASDHWLGHGPKNISDRSYWAKDQERLDSAVAWLGEQLGFVSKD